MEWMPPPYGIKCAIVMFPDVTVEENATSCIPAGLTSGTRARCNGGLLAGEQPRGQSVKSSSVRITIPATNPFAISPRAIHWA